MKTYNGRAAESAARAKANAIHKSNATLERHGVNICRHLMHDENGQYTGTLQFVPEDQAQAMFKVLCDVELLIRVNAPLTDGSTIHKAVKAVIEQARWK